MHRTMPDGDTLEELLRRRRSVRGFQPDPVPPALIERVFRLAQLTPSNCNVQPWVVHVASGDAAERLRTRLHDAVAGGADATPDFPLSDAYAGDYRLRQVEAAKALFAATGVARDDLPGRTTSFLRNFRFFDAPHAAFLFLPSWAGYREAADLGMYTHTLLLALTACGLASCAQGALGQHAGIVREEFGVGDELRLLHGIAFGYEDPAHPANAARTTRAELGETVTFHQ